MLDFGGRPCRTHRPGGGLVGSWALDVRALRRSQGAWTPGVWPLCASQGAWTPGVCPFVGRKIAEHPVSSKMSADKSPNIRCFSICRSTNRRTPGVSQFVGRQIAEHPVFLDSSADKSPNTRCLAESVGRRIVQHRGFSGGSTERRRGRGPGPEGAGGRGRRLSQETFRVFEDGLRRRGWAGVRAADAASDHRR